MADVEEHLAMMDGVEANHLDAVADLLSAIVDDLVRQYRQRGRSEIEPSFVASAREQLRALWTQTVAAQTRITASDLGLKADIDTQYLEDYISAYGARSVDRILDTTGRQVRQTILAGQVLGESLDAITEALLLEVPAISRRRAAVIVANEVHSSSQYASQRRAMASGIQLQKRWNTMKDEKVRDFGLAARISQFSHRLMQDVRVAVDGRFAVPRLGGGVELLLFPGDQNGSAGNIIGCRCIQTYIRRA